ncbi:rRNA maturation RNase YbeY [Atopobium fossor]|uniref:rRNA maturation RNase YbeY n=1 Tax=Atopobium fossor TaxID=39487 RepID=UPI00040A20CE|nr:rRNA maturation RNase YbeY [Atopobium fossor]
MAATLDMFCEDTAHPAIQQEEALSIFNAVLEERGILRECSISLSFVSDESIAELNEEWRDVAAPTDVLSFEIERPNDPDLAEDEVCELGDIVIAPEYVARQALDFGTSAADETRLMLVHGLLHLLGYDHMEEHDAIIMQRIEDKLLQILPTDGTLSATVLTRHREDA